MSWLARSGFGDLPKDARQALERLTPVALPKNTSLFHPGQSVEGFAVVLSGRVEVFLIGPSGRDILLYAVEPGQSCVQTTLGLLGGEPYTGEAVLATNSEVVVIPKGLFLTLMNTAPGFRDFVFQAFAERMQNTMHVLEKVAFKRVEARLAEALLDIADGAVVNATQAELASRIGSAREVVSRRLESFAKRGWVRRDRGIVTLLNPAALQGLAEIDSDT